MAYRIFWTAIAVQDLRGVCDFISRDNPVAAQRMGEELIKQAEAMALFPQSGRIGPEKKDPLIRFAKIPFRKLPRIGWVSDGEGGPAARGGGLAGSATESQPYRDKLPDQGGQARFGTVGCP